MPRENRKRGKKHKKQAQPEDSYQDYHHDVEQNYENPQNIEEEHHGEEPSWIRPANTSGQDRDPEAPFGYLDTDVKAYFRTVDVQMRDWQENEEDGEQADHDADPNEKKRLFFMAALTEMTGKEKQLATDPECSVILERMLHSMDDFVRRVFMDSLSGSYETLAKHRFASHVVQTLFTLAGETVSREMRGILPKVPESSDQGELRTVTQLVLDACEEFMPSFTSLLLDPFASHVTRSLLLLLSGIQHTSDSAVRSKKSATWKARQGAMKSLFDEESSKGKGKGSVGRVGVPPEFRQTAGDFVKTVRTELGENEVRALAANKVASPSLQVLLEVEADQEMSNEPGSLLDVVSVGVVTYCRNRSVTPLEASDYLNTLLRDTTSSHLLETVISRCPDDAFSVLWQTYLEGKLSRLAVHPVANFVVAKALERVDKEQLGVACSELGSSFGKLIKSSRVGVIRVMIDRAAVLKTSESEICDRILEGLEVSSDKTQLVPCALSLFTLPEYKEQVERSKKTEEKAPKQLHHQKKSNTYDPLAPKVQGALLLQSLLRLPEPYHQLVIDSILSQPISDQIKLAHHSISSRIFDALLESPAVTSKTKRSFVLSWIGHYHYIVNDRIGSRVVDRCWEFADTYMKEKIARSLIPHDTFLAGSYYGKFFARNLNLYLLRRKPDEWRNLQSSRKATNTTTAAASTPATQTKSQTAPGDKDVTKDTKVEGKDDWSSPPPHPKRKRNLDEIDELFESTLGKKVKRAALAGAQGDVAMNEEELEHYEIQAEAEEKSASIQDKKKKHREDRKAGDHGLEDVLGAIRSAPKSEGKSYSKKAKKKKH